MDLSNYKQYKENNRIKLEKSFADRIAIELTLYDPYTGILKQTEKGDQLISHAEEEIVRLQNRIDNSVAFVQDSKALKA